MPANKKDSEEPGFKENGVTKLAKTFVMIFCILSFVAGFGCIGVGIWMCADPYVRNYFIVFRRDYDDYVLSASPGILIVCGMLCIAMAIVGIMGIRKTSRKLLLLYSIVLVIIFIMEVCVGFLCVVFEDEIHKYLKDGMKQSIQTQYMYENEVGHAWNFVQVRTKCCGADGGWDYDGSMWFYDANAEVTGELEDPTIFVPKTCCVLEYNQDRDPSKVNPQDPRPKDEKRCQEDAQGKIINGDYIHYRGCYARMLDFMYEYITALICIGLIIGFLQVFGFIASAYLTCSFENEEEEYTAQQQQFLQQQQQLQQPKA